MSLYHYEAVITSVYDGDTATANLDLGFGLWRTKTKLRLLGINTPEIRGGTPKTKEAARAARDYLKSRCLGKKVRLYSAAKGKYGRFLAVLWCLDEEGEPEVESLNDALVRLGHATPYPAN